MNPDRRSPKTKSATANDPWHILTYVIPFTKLFASSDRKDNIPESLALVMLTGINNGKHAMATGMRGLDPTHTADAPAMAILPRIEEISTDLDDACLSSAPLNKNSEYVTKTSSSSLVREFVDLQPAYNWKTDPLQVDDPVCDGITYCENALDDHATIYWCVPQVKNTGIRLWKMGVYFFDTNGNLLTTPNSTR
jgi:hypothetical protein